MKKIIVLVTILIVATAGGIGWHAHVRIAAARRRLRTPIGDRIALDVGIAAVRAKIAADQASERVLAAREVPAPHATPTKPAVAPAVGGSDPARSLDKYPGLRALFRHSVAGKLALRYGAFYRIAKLTPERIQKFEAAMTEAEETRMDFELAAREQCFNPSDPGLANLRTRGETQLTAALLDALGAQAYAEYQQYQRMEPLTVIIGDMATLAIQHGDPLTVAQADGLLTSISNASSTYERGGKAEALTVDWAQVLVEVRRFLSVKQFAVLQQESDMQQVHLLLKQFYAQRNAGGG